jgi:hypothetical protein
MSWDMFVEAKPADDMEATMLINLIHENAARGASIDEVVLERYEGTAFERSIRLISRGRNEANSFLLS